MDGSQPDPSAGIDVKFADKGFLPPRMIKAEMTRIQNPASGLMVFCTDCSDQNTGSLAMFIADNWYVFNIQCIPPEIPLAGTHLACSGSIVWNWTGVPWATGYRWGTVDDFAAATDYGNGTSLTESGLVCDSNYIRYVWSYNACGHSGPLLLSQATSACTPWSCGQLMTDCRDGEEYPTVLIGDQCWFARNLNCGTRINATETQTDNGIIEKSCFDDLESNCDVYGGLYRWSELMQYDTAVGVKGLCPEGWHLPSNTEWTTLTTFLDGESVAGGKMKETGTEHWNPPNVDATNTSGFTALPGGYRHSAGYFRYLGSNAIFWSSSQKDPAHAYSRLLKFDTGDVGTISHYKTLSLSCRCLKD